MQLGNLYFDAERYDEAIKWYGDALKLAPNDVNVSTDLGVSYYYTNQPDKALEQFDHSLKLDPKHAKTLLNVGIVKAFGKQDLDGAERGLAAGDPARAGQPRRPGGEARARQPAVGASAGARRERARGNQVPDAAPSFCSSSLSIFVARALLAAVRRHRRRRVAAAAPRGRRAGAAACTMVRDPVCGTFVAARARGHARRRPRPPLLLLRRLPRQVPRPHRMSSESSLRADIVEVGRRMYARGYTASNDGNISVRLGADRLLMTPKSVCKGFMTPDMMCITDLDGRKLQGDRDPSSEMLMHLEVYRQRPDVQAVVHAHPPTATGFAVAGIPLDRAVLAEVLTTLGSIPIAEYATPSTQELPRGGAASTSRRTTACCWPTTAR